MTMAYWRRAYRSRARRAQGPRQAATLRQRRGLLITEVLQMKYEEAKRKLAGHSDLPGTDQPTEHSFLGGLWLFDQKKTELGFKAHADDVIRCLRVVNTHFNGPDPDTRSSPPDRSRIAEVAYPISGILAGGIEYHLRWSRKRQVNAEVLDNLIFDLGRIAYAWDQVLAGDVSDILEGFELSLE